MDSISASKSVVKQLKQCQNCMRSEADLGQLLSCSACKRVHYCSKQCQKAHWKSHKAMCEMTRNMRQLMKENPESSAMIGVGVTVSMAELVAKKWVQQFRGVLVHVGFVALNLRAHPERRLTHFVYIVLNPTFTGDTMPTRDADVRKAFVLDDAAVMSLTDASGQNLEGLKISQDGIERSKEKFPDSIGFVVLVCIPACNSGRFVPLMVKEMPPECCDLAVAPDWRVVLEEKIASGTNTLV